MSEHVILATFPDESKTYQAFSEIKHAAAERKVSINGLTIIHRNTDGTFETRDATMKPMAGSTIGGLIGSIIGLAGGPAGFLLGWGAGALVGGFRDARAFVDDRTLFQHIVDGMEVGNTVLIGELEKEEPYVVDHIVRNLGGELLRRSTADVMNDIRGEHDRQSQHTAAETTEALTSSDSADTTAPDVHG